MTSDCGEDLWALSQFPEGFTGYACELGALDGVYLSNTQMLEELGWTVLCIEPNPRFYPGLREKRKLVLSCACGPEPKASQNLFEHAATVHNTRTSITHPPHWAIGGWADLGGVPVLTLDQCLAIVGFPRLDLLSLDVDGIEMQILEGFDIKRWDPKVVIVEEGDGRQEFIESAGYRMEKKIGYNLCFVRNDA